MISCKLERDGQVLTVPWTFFLYSAMIAELRKQGYEKPLSEFELTFKQDCEFDTFSVKAGDKLTHWS